MNQNTGLVISLSADNATPCSNTNIEFNVMFMLHAMKEALVYMNYDVEHVNLCGDLVSFQDT